MKTYRPEIDLIRSVAILSVFLFHLYPSSFLNGYLGVDVFFVISGFLITNSIIYSEKFSLSSFYERRIKRILPSAYFLVLVTSVLSIFFYLPNDLEKIAKTGIATLTFTANYNLKSRNYFDTMSEENPFLHMWSLAIEEQFYLFWPLLLILLFKIKNPKQRYIAIFLLIIYSCITSLVSTSPEKKFFLIQYRAYELLIGCISSLALSSARVKLAIPSNKAVAPVVLIVFLMCFVINYDPGTLSTLVLLVFTALCLCFLNAENVNSIVYRPLIFIGKNSFQIYLWHWPAIAIYRYLNPGQEMSYSLAFGYFITIVLISNILRLKLESKIYHSDLRGPLGILSLLLLPGIFLLILNLNLIKFQNYLDIVQNPQSLLEVQRFLPDKNCHEKIDDDCLTVVWKNKKKILLAGDSNAGHYFGYFEEMAQKEDLELNLWSADACPPLLPDKDKKTRSRGCRSKQDHFRKVIDGADIVILAGNWPLYNPDGDEFIQAFSSTIKYIENLKKTVIVVARIPILNSSEYYSYVRNKYLGFELRSQVIRVIDSNRQIENRKILNAMVGTNAKFLDLFPDDFRNPFVNGFLIYKDPEHLNYNGSRLLYGKFPVVL